MWKTSPILAGPWVVHGVLVSVRRNANGWCLCKFAKCASPCGSLCESVTEPCVEACWGCSCVVVLSCACALFGCGCRTATMTRPVLFCIIDVRAHHAVAFSLICCRFLLLHDSAISSVYAYVSHVLFWIRVLVCVTCDFSFCFMAVALVRFFSPFVFGSLCES